MHLLKNSLFSQQSSKEPTQVADHHVDLNTRRKFWTFKLFFALAIGTVLLPSLGSTVFAYSRDNATRYADQWALSRNPNFTSFGNDCTNFVSQALAAGGYHEVTGDHHPTNDNNWYYVYLDHSYSWTVAPDQYNFQYLHYPGGYLQDIVSNSRNQNAYWANYDNINMIRGDELFYDWTGAGIINHVAFQVWAGQSQYYPNGQTWYGDLSDQHTTDRYHVSWNHIEVNPQWPTTVIWEVHIDDRN
jgi:hypothetical protein